MSGKAEPKLEKASKANFRRQTENVSDALSYRTTTIITQSVCRYGERTSAGAGQAARKNVGFFVLPQHQLPLGVQFE